MAVDYGQYDPQIDAAIAARPEVESSTAYVAFTTWPLVNGRPDFAKDFETLGTFDGRFFTMDRFAPTSGRLPDPDRSDEIAMNETAAQLYGYHVGEHLDFGTYSAEQTSADSFYDDPPPPVITSHVTIVGIGLFVDEVIEDDTNRSPLALVTPAFSKLAAPYASYAWQGLRLRNGDADIPSLKQWYVQQLDPGSPQFFRTTSVDTFHAEQAVRPLSLAMAIFGAIAAAATLVLVGQAVSRRLRHGRPDRDLLHALGASPRMLTIAALVDVLAALLIGSGLAVAIAYLASPLMPIGAVRRVAVEPGFDADATVLGLGALALFTALAMSAVLSALHGSPGQHERTARPRHSKVASAAARAGMSPSAVAGLRRAFDGASGTSPRQVRPVIVAGMISAATIMAAVTFGASFRVLLASPPLYGWNWDAAIFDQSGYGNINLAAAHAAFDKRPEIVGWSGGYFGTDSLDGRNVALLGLEVGSDVTPPILTGRMIRADDEIVLGTKTASMLGKDIGDNVDIGVVGTATSLTIVGTATLPTLGISHGAHTSLGVGAIVAPQHVPGYDRQAFGEGPSGTPASAAGPPVVFIRFSPDAPRSATDAIIADAAASIGQYPGSAAVIGPQRPAEIVNTSDVGSVPVLLACALGAGTSVALAIALAASVQRSRREFALLQTLGCTRRQIAESVSWQATATILSSLIIGVPVGAVLGRSLWIAFATQLDVVPHTTVPATAVAVVITAGLVVANLAATLPALIASRTQPAVALRSQ
ncbi:MAG: hypothetical protein JWN62_4694 [Acidimicrobiales bacterium]|nr:hypothetical protein [Acidimicrobiales bacterium]